MAHGQNIRATDANGTSEFTFSGTGVSVKDGGIHLNGGTPVAGFISGATLVSPEILGDPTGVPVTKVIAFTETNQGAAGVYTGTVALPAGSVLLALQAVTTVLWNDATSASMDIGDDDDPDGWFSTVSVKATDLAVGEVLDISNAENWGATQGAYLVAATGRKGNVAAGNSGVYYGVANSVTATITVGAGGGSAGRTFVLVTYCVGVPQDGVFAAS